MLLYIVLFAIFIFYIQYIQKETIQYKKQTKSKSNEHKIKTTYINSEFLEMQYNKDYNDVITAINNLTPQKELFNNSFLPVVESRPENSNVKKLVKWFIKKLNSEINNNVQEYLHTNSGWNDMGKLPRMKTGREEQLENLGIPSLHTEPADKSQVKLITIDKTEQHTTDNQIRFVIYIIIQKYNVHDQMMLKIQFFMERDDNNNDFFTKSLNETNDEQTTTIEQVFIVGYLTNKANKKTKMDKFHDYKNIHQTDGIIDQTKVIKQMIKKHRERTNELNVFMASVDDETREIHNVPVNNKYKNTRTIEDDLHHNPQYAFNDITI